MTRLNKPKSKLTWLWVILALLVLAGVLLGLDYLDIVQLGLY
ncbi:hypothetical protein [Deinococcus gobiensis]|uniref:Uncharacterized protein n=1 Tax=Deinococcus gobiensis (strain DSM 21396 / JCM 16679 / CGMCC 1.7299 / I-0) TaxID=745776 RepID=H8GTN3_DEIGI|nr:hypothetical protein [Deinococcus gobiensis]AFD25361.1 hypothetical protein DGo_CA1434 [Deinococcus gobiensis I-0]